MLIYLKLVVFIGLCFLSCNKSNTLDRIDYLPTLIYTLDKQRIDHGNLVESDQYTCWNEIINPLEIDGQLNLDLCYISYHFQFYNVFTEYSILLRYTVLDSIKNLNLDSIPPYHKSKEILATHFQPKEIPFTKIADSLGLYLIFVYKPQNKIYQSIPPHGSTVNTLIDPRIYFRFIEPAIITEYGPADLHAGHGPKYKINARGQFAAVLYAADGDSITITNGEFRLPFCE